MPFRRERSIPLSEQKWGYRPAHHVFELMVLLMGGLVAIPLVAGALPAPSSTASFLPPHLLDIWAWMLLIGAALGAAGLLWFGRKVTGLVLEQVGLIMFAGAVLLYVTGLVSRVTWGAAIPTALVLGFGAACLIRTVQLRDEIRELVRHAQEHDHTKPDQDMRDTLRDRAEGEAS